MKIMRKSLLFSLLVFLLAGCNINSNLMFKTDRNYKFDTPPENQLEKYRIERNDILEFRIYTNSGYRIIEFTTSDDGQNANISSSRFQLSYFVDNDGTVKLPLLNKVYVKDSTIRGAEFMLEEMFSQYFVDPFVQITVTNKRVLVFPGNGSDAKVIPLINNNTTLMEAIALAGGITDRGKAARVKVFRRDGTNKRKAYLIDLSTIDGLKYADMYVQANDYIYVEPVPQYGREFLAQVAPYVSILSSAILIYTVFQRIK